MRDLFRLLHAVRHGAEALQRLSKGRQATASMCLAIILGRIASGTLAPPLNSGAKEAPASVQALVLAVVGP